MHDPGDPKSLGGNWVTDVVEGRFGALWVSTGLSGVSVAGRHASTFEHYRHEPGDPNSLSDDLVYSIYEDESGALWVGTLSGELNRFDRKAGTVERYRHQAGNPRSLSGDVVTSIYEDEAGRLWVGTSGGGLDRLNQGTNAFVNYSLGKGASWGTGAAERRAMVLHQGAGGTLWVGTNDGLVHFDPESGTVLKTYRHAPKKAGSLSGNSIMEISDAPGGRL